MLISIGRRGAGTGLAGLVLDCHARIRHFSRLAVRLATEPVGDAERAEAAASVARYFADALPLHITDEEESLLPRLRGREPALDAALARMHGEHDRDDAARAETVALARRIAADPGCWPSIAERFTAIAIELERHLLAHVEAEEATIVPAIDRLLAPSERDAIVGEMRVRRASAYGPHAG